MNAEYEMPREAVLFDWDRFATYAAQVLGADLVRFGLMRKLTGGAIQQNWSVDVEVDGGPHAGHHAWVVRTDAPSAVASSRGRGAEFELLAAACAAGVPVPKPWFSSDDARVCGRGFLVMSRVDGVAAGHRLSRDDRLVPDRPLLMQDIALAMARLHAMKPAEASAAPSLSRLTGVLGPPPTSPTRESLERLWRQLESLPLPRPAVAWGLRWLQQQCPLDAPVCLVHRDLRTGNYLVHEGRLTALLDWEFADWGHPLEDLGWFTAACWRFASPRRGGGGVGELGDLLKAYNEAAGTRWVESDLRYWEVLAHVRWAIVAMEQAERHCCGAEPSLELALTGRLVSGLEAWILRHTHPASSPSALAA